MSNSSSSNGKMIGYGIVKAVNAADNLVLVGGRVGGAEAPVMEITLSGITCPRLSRGRSTNDEPFAWEAREFMRKKVLGKQVCFNVSFSSESRQFGSVMLGAENLAEALVCAGFATVKAAKSALTTTEGGVATPAPRSTSASNDALSQLQAQAEAMGVGMHKKGVDPKRHVRIIDWAPSRGFFDKVKGKPLAGVVDKVRDGSTFRVEITDPNSLEHVMVTLSLAGVQAPTIPMPHDLALSRHAQKKKDNADYDEPLPVKEQWPAFAAEAQAFSEARLLQHDVHVLIQGIDKFNNMFGAIIHPKGDIAVRLLSVGLAKVVKWTSSLARDPQTLIAAETEAKAKKLNLWNNQSAQKASSSPSLPADFSGEVTSVSSGDTMTVRDAASKELRLSLASVRSPRLGGKTGADEPHAFEAREAVRSRLIGKKVTVMYDYSRPGTNGRDDSHYVSVLIGNSNVAEQLLAMGLATTIKHRMDEDRSRFYIALLEAEAVATRQRKGVHGNANPEAVVDLTREIKSRKPEEGKEAAKSAAPALGSKIKSFLAPMQRVSKLPAVVEHVFAGARMKLYVPSQNCMCSFVLAGLRTPAREKNGKPDEVYTAGTDFTKGAISQRDVVVDVESLDKGDNFCGTLFYNNGQNLSILLVRAGFASLHAPSLERSKYADELRAAEAEAKTALRGVWKDFQESEPSADAEEESTSSAAPVEEKIVKVTEINDAASFYMQYEDDAGLAQVKKGMEKFTASVPVADSAWTPAKSELCAGQFSSDKLWYRVRNDGKTAAGEYRVFFVDFGNHDLLEASALRPLPEELKSVRPLAKPCVLAGVKPPAINSDYFEPAINYLTDAVWEKSLVAKAETLDRNGKTHVTLFPLENKEVSINHKIIADGWARAMPKPEFKLKDYVKPLREAQEAARRSRINIWEYGDYSDGEEEEAKRPGRR